MEGPHCLVPFERNLVGRLGLHCFLRTAERVARSDHGAFPADVAFCHGPPERQPLDLGTQAQGVDHILLRRGGHAETALRLCLHQSLRGQDAQRLAQ
jgi:hypothetical protein